MGLAAMTMLSLAAEYKIGRTTVVLTEGNWVVISENDAGTNYTGDVSGTIPAQNKWLALVDGSSQVLALAGLRASGGAIGGAKMTWGDRCKPQQNQTYHYDATRGSLDALDCERSWESVNMEAWLKRVTPKSMEIINQKGYKLPAKAVQFRHDIGTQNGTFINSTIFLTTNFEGLPSGEKPLGAASGREELAHWLDAYAAAARSSTRSFSGNLVMPAINFSNK